MDVSWPGAVDHVSRCHGLGVLDGLPKYDDGVGVGLLVLVDGN